MKAYIINLAQSSARREHIEAQVRGAGLKHELVPAIDGRHIGQHEMLIDADAVSQMSDWLRPGCVAAALSHVEAHKRIVDSGDESALVLEDDAMLGIDASELLARLASELTGAEIALLYYRSLEPCSFSRRAAVPLPAGFELMYPLTLDRLNGAVAYVITAAAARKLRNFVIPVRAGPDSWGFFYDHGVLDRLRCVVPRPFGTRTDFKSTVDYFGDSSSALQRLATAVADKRVFPFHQVLGLRRATIERRMSRFSVVDEPSPYYESERVGK